MVSSFQPTALGLVLLILLCSVASLHAETIILDSPYDDYATHSVEATFGQEDWDYQDIGVNIHIGRLFAWEERGLARFNTAMIPNGAQVQEVILHVIVIQNTLDPSTLMDVTSLYTYPEANNAVDVAQSMTTVYADDLPTMLTYGLHSISLNTDAASDLQTALDSGQDWWGVGFTGTNDGDYTDGIIEGYNGSNPPYLEVIYDGAPPYAEMHFSGTTSTVPAAGGPLSYTVNFDYNLPYATPGLAYWVMVDGYSGTLYGPVYFHPFNATPGMSVAAEVTHDVPANFDSGTSNLIGYIGFYPQPLLSDSFAFLKFFSAGQEDQGDPAERQTVEQDAQWRTRFDLTE